MEPLTKARWQMKRTRPWMHSDHLWKGHIGEFLFQSMSQSVEDPRHLVICKGLVWGSSTKGPGSLTTISGVIVQELISSLWETDARDQYQKVQMGCWREKERLEGRAFLPLPLSLFLYFSSVLSAVVLWEDCQDPRRREKKAVEKWDPVLFILMGLLEIFWGEGGDYKFTSQVALETSGNSSKSHPLRHAGPSLFPDGVPEPGKHLERPGLADRRSKNMAQFNCVEHDITPENNSYMV